MCRRNITHILAESCLFFPLLPPSSPAPFPSLFLAVPSSSPLPPNFGLDNSWVVVITQGDYWRYLAEVHTDAEREKDSSECQTAYSDGLTVAQETLASTHSLRLGIALNYSGDSHNKSPAQSLWSTSPCRFHDITTILSSRAKCGSFFLGGGEKERREGGGLRGHGGFVMRFAHVFIS